MRKDLLEQKDQILQWVSENQSKAYMARQLNCNPKTVTKLLEDLGIQYKGNKAGKGTTKARNDYMPLEQYLLKSADIQTNKVRVKLLREGYKEHRCEHCGLTTWLGNPIPLEVHHKDGNRHNNVLENYELLCPNCHAFTESYRGKNVAK